MDTARPASTVVPVRGRPGSKKRKKASQQTAQDPQGSPVSFLDQPVADVEIDADRSRLVSAIVFWAPALVLLVLAAAVVWVVR